MAPANRGREKLYGLLGELLSRGNPLGRSQRPRLAMVVFALFAIELGPLGLMAWLQERPARGGRHRAMVRPGRAQG